MTEGALTTDVNPILIGQIDSIAQPEEATRMSSSSYEFETIVLGAGPGGYVAAIRAGQLSAELGGKVGCIEKEFLGGTCLNWGCIPSKVMIANAERYQHVLHAKDMGVQVNGDVGYDFAAMQARKEKVVTTLRGGIANLFKKHKIEHIGGTGKLVDPNTIEVTDDKGGKRAVTAKNIIIATGSRAIKLPIPGLDGENVWTSDDAVNAPFVPKSMIIIGGGAVGLEFAYVFNAMGSKVVVLELMDQIVPTMDADIAKEAERQLSRQGIKIMTGASAKSAERVKGQWQLQIETGKGVEMLEAELVLLGVGRKPNIENIGLEALGIKTHQRGIETDPFMRTNIANVFAIGDCTGRIQLAHVASMEGIFAAENCYGLSRQMDYKAVPNVVYTVPEIASVGLTEKEAKEQGYDLRIGKFQPGSLGRAMAVNERGGIVKVIADSKYGEILGAHICGPHASDLLQEAVLAIKLEATLDDLAETIHPHPTLTEALMEAFHDAAGHCIHKM